MKEEKHYEYVRKQNFSHTFQKQRLEKKSEWQLSPWKFFYDSEIVQMIPKDSKNFKKNHKGIKRKFLQILEARINRKVMIINSTPENSCKIKYDSKIFHKILKDSNSFSKIQIEISSLRAV